MKVWALQRTWRPRRNQLGRPSAGERSTLDRRGRWRRAGSWPKVEASLEALREAQRIYDPAHMAQAGAVIAIDRNGDPAINRGSVKQSDAKVTGGCEAFARAMIGETWPDTNGPAASEGVASTQKATGWFSCAR